MTTFDVGRLDDADALARQDHSRLLWTLALAGAQIRRAGQVASEWRPQRLDLGGAPRALLVATDAPTAGLADLVATIATPAIPTAVLRSPELPRWAGAADAALVVSLDGRHPRLVALTEQAARRGLSLAVVAPVGSPVAVAAGRAVVVDLPADTAVRAAFWSALGPVLIAADAWAVHRIDGGGLEAMAAALDEVAHRCRPGGELVTNAAKSLAEEFADATPVLVGCGPLAGVVARMTSAAVQISGGVPAVALELPDDVGRVAALITGSTGAPLTDFFRDRVEDTGVRPRLLIVGDDGEPDDPTLGGHDGGVESIAGEYAAREAAMLIHHLAEDVGVRASSVDVPAGQPLVRFAAAAAFGAFTAAYLALGRGLDPSAPRPGERG